MSRKRQFLLMSAAMAVQTAIGCSAQLKVESTPVDPMNATQDSNGFGRRSGPPVYFEHRSEGRRDLGGVFEREGLKIDWAGSAELDGRVRPRDVVAATVQRLEAEQKTDLGSDANARAMALLMEAQAILDGTQRTTEFGPVIE